ncbi:hypothetical protein D3C73_860040 [compost metagenome]|uniref:DUF6491 family protein n=1 Tax=Brevundimonas diminuta TaxID=293 RepID=UPI000FA7E27E
MSARLAFSVFLCALGALAACAPVSTSADGTTATAANARKCFFQDDVRSFRASADGRNVYVRELDKTIYRLEAAGACPELSDALAIGFAPMGGMNSLCTGDYTRLVVGGSPSAMPCSVRMAGALTEAEVAALPARDRP